MIVYRYLSKKILLTMIGLTAFLSVVILEHQLLWFLNLAVNGKIPPTEIVTFLVLEFPIVMHLVLPLGLLFAMVLSYSQLYSTNELPILHSFGFGSNQLLKFSLKIAAIVALGSLLFVCWLRPTMMAKRIELMYSPTFENFIKTIPPKQFRSLQDDKQIIYVEAINPAHTNAAHIFVAQRGDEQSPWEILWVEEAEYKNKKKASHSSLALFNGTIYRGIPGQADFEVLHFKDLQNKLPQLANTMHDDIRTLKTRELWPLTQLSPRKASEFQWRISIPIMIFNLALIAVGLSKINPRQDKYSMILPALVIFLVYANILSLCRKWILFEKIPPWFGVWWLHLAIAAFGIWLYRRNHMKL